METKQQRVKTIQIRGERYIVHERPSFSPWSVYIKKDGNQKAYVPAFRTGWENGGEVEIMWNTLVPLFYRFRRTFSRGMIIFVS